jgi:hypothetical protein
MSLPRTVVWRWLDDGGIVVRYEGQGRLSERA